MTGPYHDCCIVNVALGTWYPRGQDRLRRSLDEVGYDGALHFLTALPAGSPLHEEVPYAFKTYAMREATRKGRYLLWLDASMIALRPLTPIFDQVREQGYFLLHGAYKAGEWMSDRMLALTGRSREEFMARPNLLSGCVGLDIRHAVGAEVLDRWCAAAKDGSFIGDWTNENGQVSSDPRVRGHRHDQSALETIAHRLDLVHIEARRAFMRSDLEPEGGQILRLHKVDCGISE